MNEGEQFISYTRYDIKTPEDMKNLKYVCLRKIKEYIEMNNWNQTYASALLNVDQPKISQIKNLKPDGFSLERLLKFLTLLGINVSINL